MAETGNKTKAPAKPRAASTKSTAAKATTTRKKTAAEENAAPGNKAASVRRPTHEEIAKLAEKYWAERGHTDGHAEQDWLRAEQELMKLAS